MDIVIVGDVARWPPLDEMLRGELNGETIGRPVIEERHGKDQLLENVSQLQLNHKKTQSKYNTINFYRAKLTAGHLRILLKGRNLHCDEQVDAENKQRRR